MPFGLATEQAAEGCWAEAMRLVLTPSTGDVCSSAKDGASDDVEEEEEEEEEKGGGGDGVDAVESAVEPPLTLPGGLWDPVRRRCMYSDAGGKKRQQCVASLCFFPRCSVRADGSQKPKRWLDAEFCGHPVRFHFAAGPAHHGLFQCRRHLPWSLPVLGYLVLRCVTACAGLGFAPPC